MSRHQVRKTLKYSLHEGASGEGNSGGVVHDNKVYKLIKPTKDCCINRENPNRIMSDSDALVVGFAPDGHFRGAIPHGFTHGYWTQNMFP